MNWDSHSDGLNLHGANLCRLMNAERCKYNAKRLVDIVRNFTLWSYNLSLCSHDTASCRPGLFKHYRHTDLSREVGMILREHEATLFYE